MRYDSRTLIKILKKNGWVECGCHGSHHFFKNDSGTKIVVPHPEKDLPKGTYHAILKQAGLK